MKLLTPKLEKKFPPLGATDDKDPRRVKIIAKFFDPCSQWTWYVTEYDPVRRVFFGLVRGIVCELGYFSLDELQEVKGALGLGLERDLHFGKHTLAEVMEKAI